MESVHVVVPVRVSFPVPVSLSISVGMVCSGFSGVVVVDQQGGASISVCC